MVQQQLRRGNFPVKWVAPAAMHLTLHFLGETDVALLPRLNIALGAALSRTARLRRAIRYPSVMRALDSRVEDLFLAKVRALGLADVAAFAGTGERVTLFADVGAVAFMLADPDATRGWVRQVLGSLADLDENHSRLRETLRIFLGSGGQNVVLGDNGEIDYTYNSSLHTDILTSIKSTDPLEQPIDIEF